MSSASVHLSGEHLPRLESAHVVIALSARVWDAALPLHIIYPVSSHVSIGPRWITSHARRNGLKNHVSADTSFFDPSHELFAPRLVVEERLWIIEALVELPLHAHHAVDCAIHICVPCKHDQSRVGSRSGIEDGFLTADMKRRVEIRGWTVDCKAANMYNELKKHEEGQKRQDLPVSRYKMAETIQRVCSIRRTKARESHEGCQMQSLRRT